ncbi:hypothetical protein [Nocardia sp. NPDC052566]|uniref:hypothetical protein n=1 Tax=Nocardia sp. NPDC052566 TaxID=3364330 RepID=UPI0037C5A397
MWAWSRIVAEYATAATSIRGRRGHAAPAVTDPDYLEYLDEAAERLVTVGDYALVG